MSLVSGSKSMAKSTSHYGGNLGKYTGNIFGNSQTTKIESTEWALAETSRT